MLVKYWMKRVVVTIDANDSLQEAIRRMKEHKAGLLPVMEHGNLVGVITDRDMKRASASDAAPLETYELAYLLTKIKIRDVMTKSPITVAPDFTLEEAAWLLMTNDISGAPVKDEKDQVVGVISRREIFLALISLTGLANRGIQLALCVEDQPGSIKQVTDVVRTFGGRLVSLLTSYERAPAGYRNVYVRACRVDRSSLAQMLEALRQKGQLLYMVDHRENQRVEYEESPHPETGGSVAGDRPLSQPRKIVYCTDFSENSIPARLCAIEYAKSFRAELIIVHVLSSRLVGYPFFEEAIGADIAELQHKLDERVKLELDEVAKECGQECALVRTSIRSGVTATEIVRCANELSADLIVMGTHGWSGLKHLILGSTVENVLRIAGCPVLIVRSASLDETALEEPGLPAVP
jgi:acetoin utilization protein AcuB